MTEYRTGNHHGITIVAEGDGARCGRPDHDCARGHLVAVVVDGSGGLDSIELAERICALLNEGPVVDDALMLLRYALHLRQHGERAPGGYETWAQFDRRCEDFLRRCDGTPGTAPASTEIAGSRERADVRRRIAERAEHRPSSLGGDGLGYGPCVGCGELWPCAQSRRECP